MMIYVTGWNAKPSAKWCPHLGPYYLINAATDTPPHPRVVEELGGASAFYIDSGGFQIRTRGLSLTIPDVVRRMRRFDTTLCRHYPCLFFILDYPPPFDAGRDEAERAERLKVKSYAVFAREFGRHRVIPIVHVTRHIDIAARWVALWGRLTDYVAVAIPAEINPKYQAEVINAAVDAAGEVYARLHVLKGHRAWLYPKAHSIDVAIPVKSSKRKLVAWGVEVVKAPTLAHLKKLYEIMGLEMPWYADYNSAAICLNAYNVTHKPPIDRKEVEKILEEVDRQV
ncbi:MAG: hypothetical protein C0167_01995, partial [Nitrososphaera sp.]